ncbi:hypothetical protein [Nonomuraea rubra]|uniref:2,4-dienoyl-CoA reductase-like NADH-dependent reductase (Old Yellow Enzyme family) n=1 Tax=Nonomuraea rubra TaxID=46180 RepID=A0A7X0NPG3_9ACTN|nr:hypothetical protein [Nonomuraea rubra]MBB6547212.1 2,4-dienoyl-CoA reductase-like NADH-dependent reductase (Old Yellow Enzyme family) [Nonomuraea rubra]
MLRRALAGCLMLAAAGLATVAAPAAHADFKAPYARAAAIIDADGSLNESKNVVRSWRAGTGRYCVQLAHHIDAREALIQLTPRHMLRLPYIAYRHPSATCRDDNTITVNVYSTHTSRLADSGFDLLVS